MSKALKKFFWVCSGATVPLLEPCETEHNRYVGIGATVFMTGSLAGISAGYALYTVFWSWPWAAAFGTFWGLMIFNLDRFIILSIKKKEEEPSWDWKRRAKEKARETLALLPRLAIAVLLAFIITKPLELKLFEKEVGVEIETMRREEEDKLQASLLNAPAASTTQDAPKATPQNSPAEVPQTARITSQINAVTKEVETLREKISKKQQMWQKAENEANCECLGTCGSGRFGVAVNCKRERAEADILKADYLRDSEQNSEINQQISAKLKNIADLERVRGELAVRAREASKDAVGLATRLSAFDRLTARDPVYGAANLALMLLLILFETAPILTKLFIPYGPYDRALETSELRQSVAQMKEQLSLVDDVLRAQKSSEKNREAVDSMHDMMTAELASEMNSSRGLSAQLQAEWTQAKHEQMRRLIAEMRQRDRKL